MHKPYCSYGVVTSTSTGTRRVAVGTASARRILSALGWACLLLATLLGHGSTGLDVINWEQAERHAGTPGARRVLFVHMHSAKTGGNTLYRTLPALTPHIKPCPQIARTNFQFRGVVESTKNFTDCNYLDFEGGMWMSQFLPRDMDVHFLTLMRNPLELRIAGLEKNKRDQHLNPDEVLEQLRNGSLRTDVPGRHAYHMENFQAKMLMCGPPVPGDARSKFRDCNYTLQEAETLVLPLLGVHAMQHAHPNVASGRNAAQRRQEWHARRRRLHAAAGVSDGEAAAPTDGSGVGHVHRRPLWWVGITEFYDTSVCVLRYQLGAFDAQACDCNAPGGSRRIPRINKMKDSLAKNSTYSVSQIKLISEHNRHDLMLYGLAVARLAHDAQQILMETGVDIFC